MKITPVEKLIEQANAQIETWTAERSLTEQGAGNSVLVDIRDIRELGREGKVADAVHAPRGMLEFWFDPSSKYHREIFAEYDKRYVLFCAMGWRSALAAKTLKDMGFTNIAHVDGGFAALKEAGAEIEEPGS
ncbi:MAG: rhodanese-like domain-containing protein [Rhizobiaceae bacterium]